MLVISGYTVEKIIDQGAMGTVYLAVQDSLDRQVAIKVMDASDSFSEECSRRFLLEAKIIASFQHKHIVGIHDFGKVNQSAYIVMELLAGGNLRGVMSREGALPVRNALGCALGIARALQYAHQRNVVHRDVKPSNILFRKNGTLVLTDFGIAKLMDSDKELTQTGNILGTPHYVSPEQVQGGKVDGRSDIYSLGVILYEMLSGTKPYDGDGPMAILFKHVRDPIPSLPESLAKLQPLVDRTMAKDPEQRFSNVAELVTALHTIREDFPAEPIKPRKKKKRRKESDKSTSGTQRIIREPTVQLLQEGKQVPPLDKSQSIQENQDAKSEPTKKTAPQKAKPRRWPFLLLILVLIGLGVGSFFLLEEPFFVPSGQKNPTKVSPPISETPPPISASDQLAVIPQTSPVLVEQSEPATALPPISTEPAVISQTSPMLLEQSNTTDPVQTLPSTSIAPELIATPQTSPMLPAQSDLTKMAEPAKETQQADTDLAQANVNVAPETPPLEKAITETLPATNLTKPPVETAIEDETTTKLPVKHATKDGATTKPLVKNIAKNEVIDDPKENSSTPTVKPVEEVPPISKKPESPPLVISDTQLPAPTESLVPNTAVSEKRLSPPFAEKEMLRAHLLKTIWLLKGQPIAYLPSSLTYCKANGAELTCVSKELEDREAFVLYGYKITTSLSGFTRQGEFQIDYRKRIVRLSHAAPRGISIRMGWQKGSTKLACYLEEIMILHCGEGEKAQRYIGQFRPQKAETR